MATKIKEKIKEYFDALFSHLKTIRTERRKLRSQSIQQETIQSKKRLIDEIRKETAGKKQDTRNNNQTNFKFQISNFKSYFFNLFHKIKSQRQLHKLQRNYQKITSQPTRAFQLTSKINYYFQYLIILIKDLFSLLVHPTNYHFFRVQTCGANPDDPIRKNKIKLVFSSYSALKIFQRRLRVFTFSGAGVISIALILVLASQTMFLKHSLAASYSFVQSSWSGGASTTNFPNHTSNQTGWTQYYSADPNVSAGANGVTLSGSQTGWTQTSDTDFNTAGNSKTQTYVSGTLAAASITLLKPLGTACTADSQCSDGSASGGGGTDGWCYNSVCTNPWISGPCGTTNLKVNRKDLPTIYEWETTQTSCAGPQCATGLDASYPSNESLVADNTVNFSSYPARAACQAIGGRLPTMAELSCIYTNRSTYSAGGAFQNNYYWSSTEGNSTSAYTLYFTNGSAYGYYKTYNNYVRCVTGQ